MKPRRIAVLGALPGGLALTAHLVSLGHTVHLWDDSESRLAALRECGVTASGLIEGFFMPRLVTTDLAAAVADTEMVMVATEAREHARIAGLCARQLKSKQLVVLNPGRTGGALEFRHVLMVCGHDLPTVIGEAASLPYGCSSSTPGTVQVKRIKRTVMAAFLPASSTGEAAGTLRSVLPLFEAAPDVLATGLQNVGSVLHPTPMLMNAARVESPEKFGFYQEGITPFVATYMTKIDDERVAIAQRFGADGVEPLGSWLKRTLGAVGEDLMAWKDVYSDSVAPTTMMHRYVLDDVPYSLVPTAALGRVAGVDTPAMDALIDLFSVGYGIDFKESGRGLGKMGLEGVSRSRVIEIVRA